MIRPMEKKTIESGGETLDEAKYHIDPSALPNITSILRGLYSDPLKAVLREYITNAVDAHVEAGVPDVAIEIHLPTRVEPFFSVRDYGNGLDIEHTKKLLYGYGASGDLKRESNTQIGGFGIGCKCAFSVAEAFTYTIWHGGRKRIWSCFLDESDTGLSKLLYDEEDTAPPGVEVNIAVKVEYDSERRVQQAINELLMFLPGEFKLTDSCARYTLPTPPKAIVEQEVQSTVNGRTSRLMFQFYSPNEISGMPMIVVGGTSYTIAQEHLDEAWNIPDIDRKKLERARYLSRQLAVQCPVGFLQIAPSREELQYSGLTKKVLRSIFQTMAAPEFMDGLTNKVKAQLKGSTILERRQQSNLLGIKIHEDQSNETGLYIDNSLARGAKGMAVYGMRYIGSAYATRFMEHTGDSAWNAVKNQTVFSSGLLDATSKATARAVFVVDTMPSEEASRKIASQLATKLLDEGGRDAGIDVLYAVFLEKADVTNIKWIADGSIPVYDIATLPEVNTSYFRNNTSAGVKARTSSQRSRGTSLGTKFLELGASVRSGVGGDGAWWNPKPLRKLTGGVYVKLNQYRVQKQSSQTVMPDHVAEWMKYLKDNGLIELLPRLSDGLLGVKLASVTPELEASKEFTPLWEYMRRRFKEDVDAGKIDTEALLSAVAFMDMRQRRNNDLWKAASEKLNAKPGLKDLGVVRQLAKWQRMRVKGEDVDTVTGKWVRLIAGSGSLLQGSGHCCPSEFMIGDDLLTPLGGLPMFDLSKGSGALTKWWNSEDRKTLDGWLRISNMAEVVPSGASDALKQNPLEAMAAELCVKLPLITEVYCLKDTWVDRNDPVWYYAKRDAAKDKLFLRHGVDSVMLELLDADEAFIKYLSKVAR